MPRVKKYHEGGKGPGHPHYTIDNKAERQAADAADYYDRYPERRPEAIAKKKEERGTLFDSAADFFQYSPIIGEIVDLLNIPYVAATGKDVYKGEPQSVQSAAAWGVGGLLLPNLIEKPAKWLIKQGAKNADDVASILRHFSNRNAEDIPADLKPLLNFSKKNNEMRAFLSDKSPGFPFAGMDNVGSNKLKDVGGDLHDYIVKNRPDLIDKFSVKNFESGMFDEVTRAWGDEYLVSLRGVRDAKNVDEAADFLTSAKGGGERVQGPGINTSGSLNQVEPFGSGSQGYIGRLKVNEPYSSSANASTILDNIYNLEKEGGKLIPKSDDSRFLSKSGVTEGINTIDGTQVRVIKENTPVTVEDIIKTEGNDLSKIFRNPSEVTILGNPSVRNADYDKILDWTRSSGGDLNELYNTVLKKGSYKQGGKALKGLMKKYHTGGNIMPHPHPHPVKYTASVIPGYTAPVIPGLTDNNPLIGLIDAPKKDRLSEFGEVKKADWSTILANPMQAWEHISKNGFTRPTQAELNAQGGNIYDGVMSMFNPAAYVEAVKGLDSSLTAADEALLSGVEDGRLSPGDLSNIIGDLSDAGMQALFLSIAPTAGKTLLGAAKELRRPALNTLTQEFRGSRLLGETKGVEPVSSSPLQQLTGERQLAIESAPPKVKGKGKGKGKKYQPVNTYEESNVAANKFELGPTVYYENTGVYQYPSFMTGSKLERQVSAKDGTIARSTLEQLVKNKNTKPSEAMAVEDVLGEFEGKRIPYGNFKQSLALDIRPAEIVKTDEYAGTGVESLGYAQGVVDVTAKTNLYKDKSLGLTKEGESHFPDQPHSFWIRSMSTAEEPNVLKALEWQTDVESLKDPSKGLLVSDDASNYSNFFESSDYSNLNNQIDLFKEEIRLITNVYPFIGQKGVVVGESILPKKIVDDFARLKKGLQIAEDHKKESLILAKAAAKGLPLKFVNESLLDAARQGKEYLDVPTAETVFTIEGWSKPNSVELESLYEEQSDIVKRYDTSLPPHGDTIEAITQNIDDSIYIHRGIETLINKNVKEKERIYDQLIFSTERGNPVTVGTIRKLDNGSDFENTYIDYLASVVTNNGFKDPNQPKHIASKKKIIDYIKKVKSEDGIRAKEDIIKFKEAQKKLDEIKAKGFDLSKISESEMSVTKNYRNFPKLWRSEFGTDVKQVTDSKGNNWMRVKIPENFYQNDISLPPSEIKTYRKGGKALKGLMKKYNEGGLFQKLRDKRAKRRLGRTNVRNFPTGEVLESLAGTNPYSGYFRPDTRDVYMSPVTGDKSVMDHELIHSTQMGPLQQMADALGFNAGRIQDKNSRKAFRKLYRSIKKEDTILDDLYRKQQIEQGRKGNEIRSGLGDYMMGKKAQDIEFDAIIKSGLSSAANKGLDLSNKTFDEVLNELNQAKSSESTNMHHLRRFMNDTSWTDKQKVFIMDAIKANVGRKEYTVKDVKQDLR